MELVMAQIDKIEDLLAKMDEVIDSARSMPFSSKITIEKEELFSVIDEIRDLIFNMRKGLPTELSQARRVISDKDNHLIEGRSKAEMIIKAAEMEAKRLTEEHEITMQAKIAATEMRNEVNKEMNDFRRSAAVYMDGIFGTLEEKLNIALDLQIQKSNELENYYRETLEELYHNRSSMRVDF